jgi:hypothetical protein
VDPQGGPCACARRWLEVRHAQRHDFVDPQTDIQHQGHHGLIPHRAGLHGLPELAGDRFRQVTRQMPALMHTMHRPDHGVGPLIITGFVGQKLKKAAQGRQTPVDRGRVECFCQLGGHEAAHVGPRHGARGFVNHSHKLFQVVLVVGSSGAGRVALPDVLDETLHSLCKVLVHGWPPFWFYYTADEGQLYVTP